MSDREINLRLSNAPKSGEKGKRVLGFVVDTDELEHMGSFSGKLEEYCKLFLNMRGYTVEKDPGFSRHYEEERIHKPRIAVKC